MSEFAPVSERDHLMTINGYREIPNYCVNCGLRYDHHNRGKCPAYISPPVNSREGITALMEWARRTGAVLNQYHADIAKRYDVSTEGVIIAKRIPTSKDTKS